MFPPLGTVRSGLDAAAVTPAGAAELIGELAHIERLVVGARLVLAGRIDNTITGAEGESGPARWLARHTGQTMANAAKDLEASAALENLPTTRAVVQAGELSAAQAHEVTSAAALDPSAESALLGTARGGTLSELRRHARRVRAAATDHEDAARNAHANRDLSSEVDEETAEGHLRAKGPASTIAEINALLEPWIQARFHQARRQHRRERRGALGFDALLDALRHAARGGADTSGEADLETPSGPPVKILARVDVAALRRGHTIAGEMCEIDGLGPVAIEDLRALLPDAAIDLITTNGVDLFNVTNLRRRTTAHQKVVMDWIGGHCTRLGCPATRNLQIDHRIDWAHTHLTELAALDWLCPADHHRKTRDHWALVAGHGRRRMVPPDHPDHPANSPPTTGDPPQDHRRLTNDQRPTRPDTTTTVVGLCPPGTADHPHLDNRRDATHGLPAGDRAPPRNATHRRTGDPRATGATTLRSLGLEASDEPGQGR